MKKIYIDGLGLVEGHFSGVGHYILGILKGIDEILDREKYLGNPTPDIYVIIPRDTVNKFRSFGFQHIGYKSFPLSFRVMSTLWRRNWLPPIDLWCGRGAYIFPRFADMRLALSKSSIVVFDLSYELYRQYSDEGNAIFLSKAVKRSIAKAESIITISDSVRRELMDFYKLDSGRIRVATPATDPKVFYRRSNKEIKAVKNQYCIKGDYILALSNLEPRKNLEALVDVYCQLPEETRKKTGLLLVGVHGWRIEALLKDIVGRVEKGFNIMRPSSFVLDEDRPAIISGAKMLVYPSHYEGFGIPPLEALACGVPVITADNSSLPEVVGYAAKMVPSDDRKELLKAVEANLNNLDKLTQETITAGPDQAKQFSWIKSAQVFLDVAQEMNR